MDAASRPRRSSKLSVIVPGDAAGSSSGPDSPDKMRRSLSSVSEGPRRRRATSDLADRLGGEQRRSQSLSGPQPRRRRATSSELPTREQQLRRSHSSVMGPPSGPKGGEPQLHRAKSFDDGRSRSRKKRAEGSPEGSFKKQGALPPPIAEEAEAVSKWKRMREEPRKRRASAPEMGAGEAEAEEDVDLAKMKEVIGRMEARRTPPATSVLLGRTRARRPLPPPPPPPSPGRRPRLTALGHASAPHPSPPALVKVLTSR